MDCCNARVTSQFTYCSNALSMDIYKGCNHKCQYCFARNVTKLLNKNTADIDYEESSMRSYSQIIKLIKGEYKGKSNKIMQHLISKKQPIHIGGMADPFPYKVERKLRQAEQFIKEVGTYPCIWSTKNPLPEYADIMSKGNHIIQCSIIGFGDKFEQIEYGTVPPEERLDNLGKFKGKAKKIVIRMQPVIPWLFNDATLEEYVKKVSKVADAITIEFLKKDINEKFEELSKTIGIDLNKEYVKYNVMEGSDYILPYKIRLDIGLKIKSLAHKYGMEFYCAENGIRHIGDGPNCCGINNDKDGIFASKMLCNTSTLLFKAKAKGDVGIEDLLEDRDSIYDSTPVADLGLNAGNRKRRNEQKQKSIKKYFEEVYNTNNKNNPAKMFKVLKPYRDKNRNIRYKFDDSYKQNQ